MYSINIDIQPDDTEMKVFVKITDSDGKVYAGELMKQDKEFLSIPDPL